MTTVTNRIAMAIENNIPAPPEGSILKTKFDPIIGSLIASFLTGLLQACLDKQIKRQHTLLNKRPDGSFAKRYKQRVAASFKNKHPEYTQQDVDMHVTASLEAFKKLKPVELDEFIDDIREEDKDTDRTMVLLIEDLE